MRLMGVAGWSGAGKTTLLRKLIPALISRGHSVSTVKHAHHDFDIDKPGKDSWLHRQAGAAEVLVASESRFALIHEVRDAREPSLPELLDRLSPVDFVLIEGFKREPYPKIEVWRAANGKLFLHPEDPTIRAIAADEAVPNAPLPVFDLEDISAIADLIIAEARPFEKSPGN
ncbi:molybdopterin-guanine dinucleotide biosynthesis protein B [Terrihabitans sp. B22-R8]|uniref:molybdopterin-guanine dinucleotide biosynthesis protein B n=1 Tax=Terrihabitans sp. B22-R8 TaxID=3425128 RepID=UPI00403C5781